MSENNEELKENSKETIPNQEKKKPPVVEILLFLALFIIVILGFLLLTGDSNPKQETPSLDSVIGQPKEEPKKEPVKEEPKKEEPIIEEPKPKEPVASTETPKTESEIIKLDKRRIPKVEDDLIKSTRIFYPLFSQWLSSDLGPYIENIVPMTKGDEVQSALKLDDGTIIYFYDGIIELKKEFKNLPSEKRIQLIKSLKKETDMPGMTPSGDGNIYGVNDIYIITDINNPQELAYLYQQFSDKISVIWTTANGEQKKETIKLN